MKKINYKSGDTSNNEELFNKQIWTTTDVSNATGYQVSTIYNLVSKRQIPFRKCRGKLFFDPLEIRNWIFEGG
jgi:predicted DNA-binding transcriptional regulator AlpA